MDADPEQAPDIPRRYVLPGTGSGKAHSQPGIDASIPTSPSATRDGAAAAPLRAGRRPPPTSGWRYTFSSLSNRNFLLLWLGMFAMMSGMQMQMIARSFLVYELERSAIILGVVSAAGALPMLGLSLFGGVVADRFQRTVLVQGGQAVATLIALFVAVSIATGTVTWVHLLVASVLQGAMWSFMMPAREALIPQLVGQDKIGNAMALSAAGMSTTTLVAPAIAGVIYGLAGPLAVYSLITVLGAVAFILTSGVPKVATASKRATTPMMADIKDGLVYILGNRLVLVLILVAMATVLLAMPIRFFLPVLVVEVYGRESEAFGLLISAMGLGSLVGSLTIASMGQWRRGLVLLSGSLASAVALLLVALVPVYLAAVVIMVLLGLGDATRRALNQALVMEKSAERYRGRVMSVFMMNFGLMPLGVLPAGLAMDVLGSRMVIGIMGAIMLSVTVVLLITQRRLRTLQ